MSSTFFGRQGDNLVVGRWLGADALGLYGRAYQLIAMPANLFGQAAGSVLFPAFAAVGGDKPRMRLAYLRGLAAIAFGLMPLAAIVYVLAPEVVDTLFGGDTWDGVVGPLRILAMGLFFRTAYKLNDAVLAASGEVHRNAGVHLLYGILVCAASIIVVPLGINAVAAAVVVALCIHFGLGFVLVARTLDLQMTLALRAVWPPVMLALLVGATAITVGSLIRGVAADLTVIIGVLLGCAGTAFGAIRIAPEAFAGQQGLWWLSRARGLR